ncbi:MlaE family lipid ABC transporter permease subunit [Desulfopila sp. IMCC35006]|uniref:ABC transporter permease n=1 Tax=Desulfopila sp. IMCC35006 TaxID=2569542 RepID=UPI0010AB98C1|nr:MlaE family lipid ABC transporter permease subunit [Desulfopila sp. IMCC35006]TKB26580.1 MlaE family lipid ABC transporter permease subunit [Desulfopila sp. IMCC35006]
MQSTRLQKATIESLQSKDEAETLRLRCSGDWTIDTLHDAPDALNKIANTSRNISIVWDVSDTGRVDSAGMLLFIRTSALLKKNNCSLQVVGTTSEQEKLYALLQKYSPEHSELKPAFFSRLVTPFDRIGRNFIAFLANLRDFLAFTGENFVNLLHAIVQPRSIRYNAIVKNIEEAGVRALPIVTLTSFLIGVVIAYQGAVQLEKFGANIFIVDMIALSVTRELSPLITAIVVAGRTGSSYTAQLGVMKITEEIDAMRTMGFDPHRFLVLPRIIALIIALPLMIFFADIIGIGAGMFISHVHLNLSYPEFIHRLQNVLTVKHVWVGIGKGPFFAWLIATVGCFHGFQVSKNTESIGRYTTISVVNAIFLVIACDALFSVFFTELGI